MHRRKPSRSVKRKSPTSASRRSISSTRRPPEAACRSPGVVAADAAAAEPAARAEAAGAAAEAAAAAAAAAACRGGLAACAEPDSPLRFALIDTERHGRDRRRRPGHFMSRPFHVLSAASLAPSCRADLRHHSTTPAHAFDGQIPFQIPVAGESALRWRSAATGKMRILNS